MTLWTETCSKIPLINSFCIGNLNEILIFVCVVTDNKRKYEKSAPNRYISYQLINNPWNYYIIRNVNACLLSLTFPWPYSPPFHIHDRRRSIATNVRIFPNGSLRFSEYRMSIGSPPHCAISFPLLKMRHEQSFYHKVDRCNCACVTNYVHSRTRAKLN
jgi:hypothetical protein